MYLEGLLLVMYTLKLLCLPYKISSLSLWNAHICLRQYSLFWSLFYLILKQPFLLSNVYCFIFKPFVLLYLKCVSCRQNIVESCFSIYSVNLYFLTGEFRPLIFSIIINMIRFRSIILALVFFLSLPAPFFWFPSSSFPASFGLFEYF